MQCLRRIGTIKDKEIRHVLQANADVAARFCCPCAIESEAIPASLREAWTPRHVKASRAHYSIDCSLLTISCLDPLGCDCSDTEAAKSRISSIREEGQRTYASRTTSQLSLEMASNHPRPGDGRLQPKSHFGKSHSSISGFFARHLVMLRMAPSRIS